MKIDESLKLLRDGSKRNFSQSFDIIVNLKNIDLKKPENKFSKDVVLPHGRGKDVNVAIISDSIPDAITKRDIESISKPAIRELLKKHEFFLCEAVLMPLVGKVLGRYLGPKGKMPKLITGNLDLLVKETKKSVRIRVRDSPVIHAIAGSENMQDSEVKENAEKIIEEVKKALPKGNSQIKNVYLKLTMGKPVKIDM